MEGKKILIISQVFYPVNSPRSLRTTELVKEFARSGHDVTLLTIKDDSIHIPFEQKHGIKIKDIGRLRFPGIGIPNTSGVFSFVKRALRRLLLLFFEYPDIELMFRVNKALKSEAGYDLMISIAVPYPIHWGVALARKDNHKIADIWVADCGDPYYGLENDTFNALFYFAYIEKWFSKKADYITIPFEGARSAYFPEFHSKIKVIPQGLSFPVKEITSNNTENKTISFAYFGNIQSYLHYAVPFLEYLNTVDKDFRFVIYTRDKELFSSKLNAETLHKCEIRGYTDRKTLLEQMSDVNFLVHFPYQKGSQKSLKLIDYAYLAKPVLSYRNDDKSKQTFHEFLNKNFENQMPLEDCSIYKIENVAAQFLALTKNDLQLVQL